MQLNVVARSFLAPNVGEDTELARQFRHRKRRQGKIRHRVWNRELERRVSNKMWLARRKRTIH